MDPLSDVLSLLKPRSAFSARLSAGGDWAVAFAQGSGVKFTAILEGACWLTVEGIERPVRLERGDFYLLTSGRPYRLGGDLDTEAADVRLVFADAIDGVAHHGTVAQDAADFLALGGSFGFDDPDAGLLMDALPAVIHVPAASGEAEVVRWVLERLATETKTATLGASLMADHLAHMLLVQGLRAFAANTCSESIGWLAGLGDRVVGQAIWLLHAEPARRWTLSALAVAVGVSRSALAARFKRRVGLAPMDYLVRWRMRLAGRALEDEHRTVSSIAYALGYESDSAFSNAFKRVMGTAPKTWRQRRRAPA